jgi:hypothetical protein
MTTDRMNNHHRVRSYSKLKALSLILQGFELISLRSQPVESLKVVRLEEWNCGMIRFYQ